MNKNHGDRPCGFELLRDQKLKDLCGESTKALLLIDGDKLISFCTYAEQENCCKMMLLTGLKKPETQCFYDQTGYNSSDKTTFIQWIRMDR